jgi:hypothetical protein
METGGHTDSMSDTGPLTRSISVDSSPTSADPKAPECKDRALEMMAQAPNQLQMMGHAPHLTPPPRTLPFFGPASLPQLTHVHYSLGAAGSHDSHKCSGSSVAGVASAAPAIASLLAKGESERGFFFWKYCISRRGQS